MSTNVPWSVIPSLTRPAKVWSQAGMLDVFTANTVTEIKRVKSKCEESITKVQIEK